MITHYSPAIAFLKVVITLSNGPVTGIYKIVSPNSSDWFAANETCAENGKGWLPMPYKDNNERIVSFMKEQGLASSWLGIRKIIFKFATWRDGTQVDNRILPLPLSVEAAAAGRECGYLSARDGYIGLSKCFPDDYGCICEIRGCKICPGEFLATVCFVMNGKCYLILCGGFQHWFSAENFCRLYGSFPIVKSLDDIREISREIWSRQTQCIRYWIGFGLFHWPAATNTYWMLGEPSPKYTCAAVHLHERSFRWKAANCTSSKPFMCEIGEPPDIITSIDKNTILPSHNNGLISTSIRGKSGTVDGEEDDTNILIVMAVVLASAFLFIFLLFLYLYVAKAKDRNAENSQSQNEETFMMIPAINQQEKSPTINIFVCKTCENKKRRLLLKPFVFAKRVRRGDKDDLLLDIYLVDFTEATSNILQLISEYEEAPYSGPFCDVRLPNVATITEDDWIKIKIQSQTVERKLGEIVACHQKSNITRAGTFLLKNISEDCIEEEVAVYFDRDCYIQTNFTVRLIRNDVTYQGSRTANNEPKDTEDHLANFYCDVCKGKNRRLTLLPCVFVHRYPTKTLQRATFVFNVYLVDLGVTVKSYRKELEDIEDVPAESGAKTITIPRGTRLDTLDKIEIEVVCNYDDSSNKKSSKQTLFLAHVVSCHTKGKPILAAELSINNINVERYSRLKGKFSCLLKKKSGGKNYDMSEISKCSFEIIKDLKKMPHFKESKDSLSDEFANYTCSCNKIKRKVNFLPIVYVHGQQIERLCTIRFHVYLVDVKYALKDFQEDLNQREKPKKPQHLKQYIPKIKGGPPDLVSQEEVEAALEIPYFNNNIPPVRESLENIVCCHTDGQVPLLAQFIAEFQLPPDKEEFQVTLSLSVVDLSSSKGEPGPYTEIMTLKSSEVYGT